MKHILLVDDNVTNLKMAAQVLQPFYELSMAKSGKQALNYLKKNKPDLILLDLMMPEMDGYQTMEEIKMNPLTQDIPIILLTADKERESEIKGLQMGALDFITKPFEEELMLGRIEKILMMDDMRKELLGSSILDSVSIQESYDYNTIKTFLDGQLTVSLFKSIVLLSIKNGINNENLNALDNIIKNNNDTQIHGCILHDKKAMFGVIGLNNYSDINMFVEKIYNELREAISENYEIKMGIHVFSNNEDFESGYIKADKALYFAYNTEDVMIHIYHDN